MARGICRPTDGQWWEQAVIHTNQGPDNSQGYLNEQGTSKEARRRLPLRPCTWSWIGLTDLGWVPVSAARKKWLKDVRFQYGKMKLNFLHK